jgi:hypothetical protein
MRSEQLKNNAEGFPKNKHICLNKLIIPEYSLESIKKEY